MNQQDDTPKGFSVSVEKEACNNNLVPTSSTTATLVIGNALAVTISNLKNFLPEDFARFYPDGNLLSACLKFTESSYLKKLVKMISEKSWVNRSEITYFIEMNLEVMVNKDREK
jgi:arabinose-5-phosphate isomerase